jgi:hypothetical protein
MDPNKTPLERAFELAGSGQYESIAKIKRELGREGFVTDQLQGRALTRQLNDIIRQAQQPTDDLLE